MQLRQFPELSSAGIAVVLLSFLAGPRVASAQCGPQWLPGDGLPGVWPGVLWTSTMWDADGNGPQPPRLVIGGDFEIAGSVFASDVAIWDGSAWASLGFSPTDTGWDIRALAALPNGELVAAGLFTTTAGTPATNIARWNGSAWLPLGSGVNGRVYSLAVMSNGDLIAGGTFNNAGGGFASNIARWNGSTWSPLGAGIVSGLPQPARVHSLAVLPNGHLIAGGHFTIAGGNPANFIARWDGANWFPLGSGLSVGNPSDAYALAVMPNGDLIAGGGFSNAGGTNVNRIARWDGANWFAVGSGISIGGAAFSGTIWALAVEPSGNLLAGGQYDTAGGGLARGIARWDGAAWSPIASGIRSSGNVFSLTVMPAGDFVAAGDFRAAGEVPVANIARCEGTTWSRLGSGFIAVVNAWTTFDDGNGPALYAAGSVLVPGNIAKWDGIEWSPLGAGLDGLDPGIDGNVFALATFDDGSGSALYAGGVFATAGGLPANNIAKWNGFAWSPVGSLTTAIVYALDVYDDGSGPALYAGGQLGLETPDGIAYGIAKWDGVNWSAVDQGIDGVVYELAGIQGGDDSLYAAGQFSHAGGNPALFIAGWDNTDWFPLGSGLNGHPHSLTVLNNGDVVVGAFVTAAGSNGIALWDGSTWSPLGAGLNDYPHDLIVQSSGDLIATGLFTQAGGAPAARIARWNGATWSTLSSGLNAHGESLHLMPNGDLVVGGAFTTAGGNLNAYWARWTENPAPWVARQPQDQTVAVSGTANFSSAPANGYSDLTYQWQRDGVDVIDGPGGASPGGGTVSGSSGTLASPTYVSITTLTIEGAQSSDDGEYTVAFTSPCGSATSAAATLLVCGCGLADLDCNGVIDLADLAVLLSNFGRQDNPPRSAGNLDGDADVDLADLTQVLSAFGSPCD